MRFISIALLIGAAVATGSCGRSDANTYETSSEDTDEVLDDSDGSDDEATDEERGGETYEEYDARRDALNGSAGEFGDYGCTEDCSGHEAGYEWAEEHSISDPDDCGGKSWSFEEGCREYAEEQ